MLKIWNGTCKLALAPCEVVAVSLSSQIVPFFCTLHEVPSEFVTEPNWIAKHFLPVAARSGSSSLKIEGRGRRGERKRGRRRGREGKSWSQPWPQPPVQALSSWSVCLSVHHLLRPSLSFLWSVKLSSSPWPFLARLVYKSILHILD